MSIRRFPLLNSRYTRLRKAIISDELLRKSTVAPEVLKPFVNRPELLVKDYFKINELVSIDEMFMNRVHYGHRVGFLTFNKVDTKRLLHDKVDTKRSILLTRSIIGTLNENMKWALYGERLGVCIFDLEITRKYMVRALEFLAHMAARGAVILFVTADKTNMLMVEKMALSAGHYAHVRKWEPDTLDIKLKVGITARAPDLIVLLSVQNSLLGPHPAIYEAARKPIPTIGICDSNANPRMVTYPIPGNDDSPTAVHYYMTLFLEAIKRGEQNPMQNKHGEWVW